MKKNVLVALAISAMLLVSCKKEDVEETTVTPTEDTATTPQEPIPLKVGNQWVYNVYSVKYDSLGNTLSETLKQIDTLTIVRKEIVDNQEYYVVNSCLTCGLPVHPSSLEQYLRTENGRLVTPKVKEAYTLHAHPEPLDSFIIDSLGKIIYSIQPYNGTVSLPAGNFENALERSGKTYYYDFSNNIYIRNKNSDTQVLYSPQIGLLSDKVYYIATWRTNLTGFRRELVSYSLN